MALERLAPDAILEQTNLTGAVADIQDDPDSPDGSWLTAAANTSTVLRASFPSPSDDLTLGAGQQEIRVLVRSTGEQTDPTADVELYENGSLVTALVSGASVGTATVLSGTFDAASLSDSTGAGVEVRVAGTPGGGNPSRRASLEVGAVEWNAEYTPSTGPKTFTADASVGIAEALLGPLQFSDDFERSESGQWGNGWTHTNPGNTSPNPFSVAGGKGLMTHDSNGANDSIDSHQPVGMTDQDVFVTVETDKLAAGAYQHIDVSVREVLAHADYYRAEIKFETDQTVRVALARRINNDYTELAAPAVVPGLTHAAGARFRVRVQAVGTSPTTIRAKVWAEGDTEPDSWFHSADDSHATLQVASGIGLRSWVQGGVSNGPIEYAFDDLEVYGPSSAYSTTADASATVIDPNLPQPQPPTSITGSNNWDGQGAVTDVDESVDSPDGSRLAPSNVVDWYIEFDFPALTSGETIVGEVQDFRAVANVANGDTPNAQAQIDVYENGVLVHSGTATNTPVGDTVVTTSWTPPSGTNGDLITARFRGFASSIDSPFLDAISWDRRTATGEAYSTTADASATVTADHTATGDASATVTADYSRTADASAQVSEDYARTADASVTVNTGLTVTGDASVQVTASHTETADISARVSNDYQRTADASAAVSSDYSATSDTSVTVTDSVTFAGDMAATVTAPFTATGDTSATVTADYQRTADASARIETGLTVRGDASATVTADYTLTGDAGLTVTADHTERGDASATVTADYSRTADASAQVAGSHSWTGDTSATVTADFSTTADMSATVTADHTETGDASVTVNSGSAFRGDTSLTVTADYSRTADAVANVSEDYTRTADATAQIHEDVTYRGDASATVHEDVTFTGDIEATITASYTARGDGTLAVHRVYSSRADLSATVTADHAATADASLQVHAPYTTTADASSTITEDYARTADAAATVGVLVSLTADMAATVTADHAARGDASLTVLAPDFSETGDMHAIIRAAFADAITHRADPHSRRDGFTHRSRPFTRRGNPFTSRE